MSMVEERTSNTIEHSDLMPREPWKVILCENDRPDEVVFLAESAREAKEYIAECRAETVGCEFTIETPHATGGRLS